MNVHRPFFFSCMVVGETLTNAGLAAANPNKAVPALDDNGFTMFERFHINFTHSSLWFGNNNIGASK